MAFGRPALGQAWRQPEFMSTSDLYNLFVGAVSRAQLMPTVRGQVTAKPLGTSASFRSADGER
eukprot:1937431-Heterocapsa_arctica.AAC.1